MRIGGVDAAVAVLVDRRKVDVLGVLEPVAVGIGIDHHRQREGAHDEQVVVVVAFQAQFGLVGVDRELVVAGAAGGDQRGVRAGAQPAARGGDQVREHVVGEQRAFAAVALVAEDLADLEAVVVRAAVQRRVGAVVVDEEHIVATETKHRHAAVDRRVVVDALDLGTRLVIQRRVAVGIHISVQQRDEGRMVGRLVGDRRARAQQEQVVVRVARGRSRGVALVLRVGLVDTEDVHRVHAVVRGASVQRIDDVVALVAAAARGVDGVAVAVGLAVERERVVRRGQVRRVGRHVHVLQVHDDEAVFAVVARRVGVLAAVHAGVRAQEDVAVVGRVPGGRAAETRRVAELEGVDVGVAPDVGLGRRSVGHRGRREGADRDAECRGLIARRHHRVCDDLAAQQHVRALAGIEVQVVTEDVDRLVGHDGGVVVEGDVVTHAQLDAAALGKDQPVGHQAQRVGVVAGCAGVAFGETGAALLGQVQVLAQRSRLAYRQSDVAGVAVCEREVERGVGLGQVDVARGFEGHVARATAAGA